MRDLYLHVSEVLEKVDFDGIWKGFTPYDFALYDHETVYFKDRQIPWDDRFLGNTAREIDGVLTALWHVDDPASTDIDLLASGLVHEMFHAFQTQQGESRNIDEFALFAYPHDLDNCQLKMAENHYLFKAFAENSLTDFEQFVVLRCARRRIIGDAMEQELNAETVEGMAEYVGLMALNQLSRHKFISEIENHMTRMRSPENMLEVRGAAYSTGAMLCCAMASLNIDFYHQLTESRTLFEIAQSLLHENAIAKCFNEAKEALQRKFDDFWRDNREKVVRNAAITGFDPMNMVRLGDQFLCYRFVMLDGEYIEGPVLLQMEEGALRQVTAYFK